MKIYITLFSILFIPSLILCGQEKEMIYALNKGVTTNKVSKSMPISWGQRKDLPNASYIIIKEKSNKTYYINITIKGQFAYGHYFKYLEGKNDEYIYIKTDGLNGDYIFVNYPLSELANSNLHDEHIQLKLVNYRTSFAMLIEF